MKQSRLLNILSVIITSFILTCSTLALASEKDDFVDRNSRFLTKYGELTFVDEKGELCHSFNAVEIRLNGKTLLKSVPIEEQWRDRLYYRPQHLIVASDKDHSEINSIQRSPESKPSDKPLKVNRLLIAEGGLTTTKMIILDFTGKEPFISRRFGYNPDLKYNLDLEKVKWGKKKAVITLLGPYDCTYYYANGRVKCEVDDEKE